jgi:hypothetical protein
MDQVRTAYEQGGGATEMPTVTRLGPNERPMTQNAVVNALQAYLANNPNATATEITAWGRANGVPDYQLRAAINERRFSMMTGGSKNAYDYLMAVQRASIQKPALSTPHSAARQSRTFCLVHKTHRRLRL